MNRLVAIAILSMALVACTGAAANEPNPTDQPAAAPTAETSDSWDVFVAHAAVSAPGIADGLREASEDLDFSTLFPLVLAERSWLAGHEPDDCYQDLFDTYSDAIENMSDGIVKWEAGNYEDSVDAMLDGNDSMSAVNSMIQDADVSCRS